MLGVEGVAIEEMIVVWEFGMQENQIRLSLFKPSVRPPSALLTRFLTPSNVT